MPSLYHTLIAQYPDRLIPVRCTEQTGVQLHRYFEDVVKENNLSSFLIESLTEVSQRPLREIMRIRDLAQQVRYGFLFTHPADDIHQHFVTHSQWNGHDLWLLKNSDAAAPCERFLLISDHRFSVLIAHPPRVANNEEREIEDELIWTFEPDIICAALAYLVKRVEAEQPAQAPAFAEALCLHAPPSAPLPLTVKVASKLAQLLQEQAGREIAVNRIATAIRKSLELESILQTTVNQVGQALKAEYCALQVSQESESEPLIKYYFRDGPDLQTALEPEIMADLTAYSVRLGVHSKSHVLDGQSHAVNNGEALHPLAVMPLSFQSRLIGVLLVRSDDVTHVWQESELLLLSTVADQVVVAVNHAHLFAQVQRQALTDVLTGCHNRRAFEHQIERDLHLATRSEQSLSLLLLDIDKFKSVNDRFGHDTGDAVLRLLAKTLREELRRVDTAARLGGEEFAVILPQADMVGALAVAERLRQRLESLDMPKVGRVTASFGVATFPFHGTDRTTLLDTADRALYQAKDTGRNRVCLPPDDGLADSEPTYLESNLMMAEMVSLAAQ